MNRQLPNVRVYVGNFLNIHQYSEYRITRNSLWRGLGVHELSCMWELQGIDIKGKPVPLAGSLHAWLLRTYAKGLGIQEAVLDYNMVDALEIEREVVTPAYFEVPIYPTRSPFGFIRGENHPVSLCY